MKKKIAAGFLCTMMLSGTALANPFDDVPKDHWAYDAVRQLADDGIIDGCGDTLFHGDRPMMRYEMAALVGRAISRENWDRRRIRMPSGSCPESFPMN